MSLLGVDLGQEKVLVVGSLATWKGLAPDMQGATLPAGPECSQILGLSLSKSLD